MELPVGKGRRHDTHIIPIPNLNDLLIRADNQAITGYLRATFYPGHPLDGQSISLVLYSKRLSRPDVIEQSVTCGGANGVRESIGPRSQCGDRQPWTVIAVNAREHSPSDCPERDETRTRQREDPQATPRSWIPKLDRPIPVDPKGPQPVCWIDIYGIHTGHRVCTTTTTTTIIGPLSENEGT